MLKYTPPKNPESMAIVGSSRINPFTDQSLWLLLISNIVTIYFALTEHWNIGSILLVYWFQSVIIGIFNFIRILQLKSFSTEGFEINDRPAEPTQKTKIYTAFFFLFHYGFFHLVYIVFIFNLNPRHEDLNYIYLTTFIFFINHLFSYFYNRPKDDAKPHIGSLMFYPYIRIIPMHLTMIAAGSIHIFLLLKTLADALMHNAEHNILRKK